MRRELVAAIVVGMGLAIFLPPTALAMPGFRSTIVETSLEKVGYWRRQSRRYWRRQSRRYWRNGYPVPYAYYPPAYGYYVRPPALRLLPAIRLRSTHAAKQYLPARERLRRLPARERLRQLSTRKRLLSNLGSAGCWLKSCERA